MNRTAILLVAAFSCAAGIGGVLLAQQTRKEITRPAPTPQEDAKSNSAAVPDVFAMSGKFDRVVVLRFKYQTDLLAGIEKMVKEQKIKDAVILSAMGSVRNYHIHQVSNRTFPSKDTYVQDPTAPADIIGMSGYIIHGQIHAHITLAKPDGAFGGHLEPGNNVFTFAVVTMGVFSDSIDLNRADDKTYR
jgi:predicted DNA-binding protein with PD1-like motif